MGEVLGEEGLKKCGGEVEMGVMVMGVTAGEQKKAGGAEEGKGKGDVEMGGMEQGRGGEGVKLAQGKSGEEVLGSDEFWDDLRGWLMQRVRDEGVVGEVWGAFKRGWDER